MATIVRNKEMHFDTLTNAIANDGSLDNCYIALYKNALTPSADDEYSDYEYLEATGVAVHQLVTWGDISDDNAVGFTVVSGLHEFRRGNDSDDPETALGLVVYRLVGYSKYMRFVQEFDTPVTLASTLDSVRIVLKYGEGLSAEVECTVIE